MPRPPGSTMDPLRISHTAHRRPPRRQTPSAHSVRITAPARAESVHLLRHRASALLTTWAMSADTLAAAELVISELLTNGALHGRDTMTLALTRTSSTLDISASDHGQTKAAPLRNPAEHGRGLALVAALTCELHVHETPQGWHAQAGMDVEASTPGSSPG
ncbi:ATP-binding protein [Streptomyces longwoodensis]|uniref:ATP-binding protein n=1 Tax=Streptomyces longwoodensis TaxID=68231 RepID=UPI00386F6C9D